MPNQLNFVVSVLPKTEGICNQIEESLVLSRAIGEFLYSKGYKFVIAEEDMMSDYAKSKIKKVEE